MTHLHHHRIRQGIVATLTGALAVLVPWTIAPLTAQTRARAWLVRKLHFAIPLL